MANPKRRHSHSRTRLRRAHDFLSQARPAKCSKCGFPVPPHCVCGYCGHYRGTEVVKMEVEEESEAKK
jgi:large subunit ribosomal protein L32